MNLASLFASLVFKLIEYIPTVPEVPRTNCARPERPDLVEAYRFVSHFAAVLLSVSVCTYVGGFVFRFAAILFVSVCICACTHARTHRCTRGRLRSS
jgi:hypothetical protein